VGLERTQAGGVVARAAKTAAAERAAGAREVAAKVAAEREEAATQARQRRYGR